MVKGEFRVRSFECIDTINQDMDVGVIRVSGARLRELGGRNALVRVSVVECGVLGKSLIRIVRAKTGDKKRGRNLKKDEIALQYDDRLALGIETASERKNLLIEKISQWLALPCFLLYHTSPLVKREALFAIALLILGFMLGFLVPSPFDW